MKLLISFLAISFLLFSCEKEYENPNFTEQDLIKFISRAPITYLNRNASILKLEIVSGDLKSTRYVEVRISKPVSASKGALVLSTGGFGTNFYGIGLETNTTINLAVNIGLETYEIKWLGEQGWGTGVAGAGYPNAVRAYGSVLRYLKKNEMVNTQNIIAHGGSGGSFQIAYGLTRFNLEKDIKHAILIAGPPTSNLQQAIFGDRNSKSTWPDGIGGFRITDYIHGWDNQGNYCQNRTQTPPDFVLNILDKSSLLSTTIAPDLDYETNLIFINTNDITNADGQGLLYFEAIQSKKEWHYLPNETSHDIGGINAGANKIREILQTLI
jgi:hypothetical protein